MGIKPAHLERRAQADPILRSRRASAHPALPESLLLQLERQSGKETIEYKIVRDHLEDLARKRHPQIAKALGTSVERVAEAAVAHRPPDAESRR